MKCITFILLQFKPVKRPIIMQQVISGYHIPKSSTLMVSCESSWRTITGRGHYEKCDVMLLNGNTRSSWNTFAQWIVKFKRKHFWFKFRYQGRIKLLSFVIYFWCWQMYSKFRATFARLQKLIKSYDKNRLMSNENEFSGVLLGLGGGKCFLLSNNNVSCRLP